MQDRGPPSTLAVVIGTAIVAGLTGYYLGQARAIGVFGNPVTRPSGPSDEESDISDADAAGSGDEDEDVQDLGELKTFPGSTEECKLVLVVRTDLGMGKGTCGGDVEAVYDCFFGCKFPNHIRLSGSDPPLKYCCRWRRPLHASCSRPAATPRLRICALLTHRNAECADTMPRQDRRAMLACNTGMLQNTPPC